MVTRVQIIQEALEEIANHRIDSELASREKRGMAVRALAAAAEVKEKETMRDMGPNWTPSNPSIKKIFEENGLTAAAEVGEQEAIIADQSEYIHRLERLLNERANERDTIRAATIERCAQVADKYWPNSACADEIRALKEDQL